ncbi:hypothetical protein [Kitasatospora sp. NPDC057015]|uniref:hypothetical protein n=1 Tax=Kitasatospora sp. NPDC057015 TaxID=3346001 RepID=UPI00362E7C8A
MSGAGSAALTLSFQPRLRAGVLRGHALVLLPGGGVAALPGTAPAPVLALRLFSARITSLSRPPAEPGGRREELVGLADPEQPRLVRFPLGVRPAAGGLECRLDWVLDPVDPRFGAAGEEMLLFRVDLRVPAPEGGERIVGAGRIIVSWDAEPPSAADRWSHPDGPRRRPRLRG